MKTFTRKRLAGATVKGKECMERRTVLNLPRILHNLPLDKDARASASELTDCLTHSQK